MQVKYTNKAHISYQISPNTWCGVQGWVTGRKGMLFLRSRLKLYFYSFEKDPGLPLCGSGLSLSMIPELYQSGSQTLTCIQSSRMLLKTQIPRPQIRISHNMEQSLCIFNKTSQASLRTTTQRSPARWFSSIWFIKITHGEFLRYRF